MRRLAAAIVGSFILAACKLGSASGTLPTYDPGAFCSLAILLPATIHVESDAEPPTWVEDPTAGTRTNLEWPVGFSLRVSGDVAEVVDPDGTVVARDGAELIDAGGGTSARGENWLAVCGIGDRAYTTADP